MHEPRNELILFLACSFARYPIDGVSDWDLAMRVKETIESESGGRIKVHMTLDPYEHYISDAVLREIYGADLVLCLFTKRTYDNVGQTWLTSSYVVSEAAAARAQLPLKDSRNRLFGIMEEGVDRMQLGLAFPRDRTVETFERSDDEAICSRVQRIVQKVLKRNDSPREDCECLSLDKCATVCRNGWVRVETRYRFRFTKQSHRVSIPHNIWRISEPLPSIATLLDVGDSNQQGVLRAVPLVCGVPGQPPCRLRIVPDKAVTIKNEVRFRVETNGHEFQPGELLEYAIAWEYPHAFADPGELAPDRPNTIGMCIGERNLAENASLTVQFERDVDNEDYDRILEETPQVYCSNATTLPAGDPVEFWYRSPTWRKQENLKRCTDRTGAKYDVYQWRSEQFDGMIKVNFVPFPNYFQENHSKKVDRPQRRRSND